MKLLTIIPNFDQRSPNKVAVELFNRLKLKFESAEMLYLNKYITCEISKIINVRKFCLSDFKISEDTLVHSHGFLPDLVNIILKRTHKNAVITSVTTLHSLIDVDLKESKGFFGKIICGVWISILKRMDTVFVLNNFACNYYRRKYGLENTKVVYNGLSLIYPEDKNRDIVEKIRALKEEYTIIGTVSVLRKMKGIQHVIGSLTENENYFLVVIGDGEYRDKLEDIAKSFDVAERVMFVGKIINPYDIINEFDVFAIMSEFEGFPLSLLEAIVLKIPCICNDIEIFRELFDDDSIVFTDISSYQAIARSAEYAKINGNLLASKALQKYASSYTWDKVTNNYLQGVNLK
ncbi:glycosyltransferase family 4 protein [Vibrio splendidus]|uniref:glycosyltransferase family 4 protein n=1 Tax=Vibrio cyclitrophicus TaxID=47951 RepID=UPI000C8292E7|nr:glycosyltransferase family 4 protein [Vibrio cyclitrophicus]PMI45228.1 hypothetical protein BCU44_01215 [Vibrio cyclitrophicus]